MAKTLNVPLIMIGHVTKTGILYTNQPYLKDSGPRTVEHMVVTVLYLDGD